MLLHLFPRYTAMEHKGLKRKSFCGVGILCVGKKIGAEGPTRGTRGTPKGIALFAKVELLRYEK
jgi:hypothetical protein